MTDQTMAPLSCQKALFSLPEGECYLNSAYMGPLPQAVEAAGHAALVARAVPLGLRPVDFFEPAERTRHLLAQLVNADPEHLAFVPTAAYGLAIAAKNLQPRPGQNVVLLADQFPSNVYPWRHWRAQGVSLRTVSAPVTGPGRSAAWTEAVLNAIDHDTLLVALEPAHWTDGTLLDLVRIGHRCRYVGAALVVDATQTVGAMPLDVAQVQPDLLVVHSYKSMLCNYGLGFAVLSDRFAQGSPLEESWLMRAGSDNFARLVDYQDDYAAGMRRYDTSLRANPVLISMLEASARLLLAWQPARIRDYLLRIARPAVAQLQALGYGILPEAERCANLFGIALRPGMDPEATRQALVAQRIHVSVRGSSVRVSPHVYNDEADLNRLAQALASLG